MNYLNRYNRAPVRDAFRIPNRESNPELVKRIVAGEAAGPGVYDEIEQGHPRAAIAIGSLVTGLGTMAVSFEGLPEETPDETDFRHDLQHLLETAYTDYQNGLRGLSPALQSGSWYWRRGVDLREAHWVECSRTSFRHPGLRGLAVEMYPIHASTVRQWDTSSSGKLLAVVQQTSVGSTTIPAASLIRVQRGGVVGGWGGDSILRPLAFPFERWKTLLLSAERHSYMLAGLVTITISNVASPTAKEESEEALIGWMNGDAPYLILPDGVTATVSYPSGTAPDILAQIEKIDSYVDNVLGQAVSSLVYAMRGTRALGDVVAEQEADSTDRDVALYLHSFGNAIGEWLAEQIGYSGRIPALTVVGAAADSSAETDRIIAALTAGAVTKTPDDERELRQRLGMTVPDAIEDASEVKEAEGAVMRSCVPRIVSVGLMSRKMRSVREALITVTDYDGNEIQCTRQLVGPELVVSWSRNRQTRDRIATDLQVEIDAIATEHRMAVWRAMPATGQPNRSETTALWDLYRAKYEAAIVNATSDMAGEVERWTREEARRQAATTGIPPASRADTIRSPMMAGLAEAADEMLGRISTRTWIESEGIATRVQSEVEQAWAQGRTRRDWVTRITASGLALGSVAIVQTVMSEGRVMVAADITADRDDDLILTGVLRTSVDDLNRCGRCKSMDLAEYDLPQDMDRLEREPTPDPLCEGAPNCRCGFVLVWGRRNQPATA